MHFAFAEHFLGDQLDQRIVVGDADGVVVLPIQVALEVARDAVEQDRLEAYVRQRVEAGASTFDVYPPNDATKAAYQAWLRTRG